LKKWLFLVFSALVILSAGLAWLISSRPSPQATPTPDIETSLAAMREKMVGDTIISRGVQDEAVLQAMRSVPRHKFVPSDYLDQAYADHPLPIGYGQTISQPFIVAYMTEHLDLKPGDKVLEIGTGSGYQAAVLASLPGLDLEIYSIEIVPELAEQAASLLKELGYSTIHLRQGDGYYGWEEAAPFDAIIVTAAPDHLPPPLAAQLAEGGRLVIPIGLPGAYQSLWKFVKQEGQLTATDLGPVSFVRFTGEGIQQEETPLP
jgi:protein-L-isoaspartate(D-aspartate) O-methyltransferase